MKKSEKIKTSGEMNREIKSDSSRVVSELDRIRERLENPEGNPVLRLILKLLCGILIGVGAVLPGVSGGVLCVIFGIYPVVMEFISHPFSNFKNKIKILMPYIVGIFIGFWGVSKMLEMLLTRFEAPCICLFIGLVAGMLPSLFVSVGEGKRRVLSYLGLSLSCIIVLGILISLRAMSVEIEPSFLWYIFCGCALAFSVIVPGIWLSDWVCCRRRG